MPLLQILVLCRVHIFSFICFNCFQNFVADLKGNTRVIFKAFIRISPEQTSSA
jgi:hypothetical protein